MSKAFVIDVMKCSGCQNCQVACKDEHCGNDWSPIAASQPDVGQFWMKVEEHLRGTKPKVKVWYSPRLCNHCEKPGCLDTCPEKAIYKRPDGLVILDPTRCTGCGKCAEACPYGVIYKNEELGICQKCSGCAHLLDSGEYGKPRCVESCPHEAIVFGEEEELAELIEGATVRMPEAGMGPKVYYRNIPGEFIAGTVYDPVEKEVVIGARVLGVSGGKIVETFTDSYGDFWLRDLPIGRFNVSITAEGFAPKYFYDQSTKGSLNLGDIPLERAAAE